MTHTYALRRLLEHGPMSIREMVECTRWTRRQVWGAVQVLRRHGLLDVAPRLRGTTELRVRLRSTPTPFGSSATARVAGNSRPDHGLFRDAAKGVK